MFTTKFKDFFKHNWFFFIFAGWFLYMTIEVFVEDFIVERSGITVSVKVEYYDRVRVNKGSKTVSRGFYYINYKQYSCFSWEILPIGSTFKIKYNPKNPEVYRRVEE